MGFAPGRPLRPLRHDRRRPDPLAQQVPEVPAASCARVSSACNFDPGASFECAAADPRACRRRTRPTSARTFEARTSWERETTAAVAARASDSNRQPSGLSSARRRSTTSSSSDRRSRVRIPVPGHNRDGSSFRLRRGHAQAAPLRHQHTRFSSCCSRRPSAAPRAAPVAKQILDELAALNDKITVVEKNFVLDTEDQRQVRRRQGAGHRRPQRRRGHAHAASTARRPATSSSAWSRPIISPAPARSSSSRRP